MNKLVRSFTFRGLPIFVAVFVAFGVGSATRADIGFAQAVATARLVYPNQTLVALERDIGDPTLYATGSVSSDATLLYGLGIHAVNGAVIAATVESVKPPEDAMMLDVLARMPLVTIDFAQALTRARAFTGRSDLLVADISLASELFMLFYDLRYTDGVRLMVDAITGQVVPVVETSTSANSSSPLAFSLATDRAMTIAGPEWHPIMATTAVTQGGLAIGTTLLNVQTGHLKQVDALGKLVDVIEFTPIGHLALVSEAIRGQFANVVVSPQQFIANVSTAYPGGRISGYGLSSKFTIGVLQTNWSALVLTALNQPLEYTISATAPIDSSIGFATVPVTFKPGDFNRDGHVYGDDLAELLAMYGQPYPPYDLNQDGFAQGEDLAILLSNWG